MIRVLQCVNDMHRAGLETMLMNYYRCIDRKTIQFDFLTHRPHRSDYDDEIEQLGGKMYYAPRLYPQNYNAYFKWMKKFFSNHPEYQIIHSHIDTMSYLPLLAAKKAEIPYRIAHSHNTSIDKDFKYLLKQYFRRVITHSANLYCACGREAGEFLFPGKNITYIPNAIEKEKFLFDVNMRKIKRKELQIGNDKFVVGHVGRLSYQKNHRQLIQIFANIVTKYNDAVLILIGTGEKEGEIKEQVQKLGIGNNVQFLGNRSDVNELYQAMDVFVMPSFFEGIPVVGIEAQFAGLPCVFSSKVPAEVKFTSQVHFINLNAGIEQWVKIISQYYNKERRMHSSELLNNRYDIKEAYHILEDYYLNIVQERRC